MRGDAATATGTVANAGTATAASKPEAASQPAQPTNDHGERLDALDAKAAELAGRVDQLNDKIAELTGRLDQLASDERLKGIEAALIQMRDHLPMLRRLAGQMGGATTRRAVPANARAESNVFGRRRSADKIPS